MVFVPGEGLPKNISIEEFCTKHGVDFPTFDNWYSKTHKKVYPITVTGIPAEEEAEIQAEVEKVSEESWMNHCIIAIPYQGILNLWKKTS